MRALLHGEELQDDVDAVFFCQYEWKMDRRLCRRCGVVVVVVVSAGSFAQGINNDGELIRCSSISSFIVVLFIFVRMVWAIMIIYYDGPLLRVLVCCGHEPIRTAFVLPAKNTNHVEVMNNNNKRNPHFFTCIHEQQLLRLRW
jgi:hypothetical protein